VARTARYFHSLEVAFLKMANPKYGKWIESVVDAAVRATEEGATPAKYPEPPDIGAALKRLVHYAMVQGMWLTALDVEEHREAAGRARHKGQTESVNGAMTFADRTADEDDLPNLRKKLSKILKDNIVTSEEWEDVVPVEAVNWLDRYTPTLAGITNKALLKRVNNVIQDGLRNGDTLEERVKALRNTGRTLKRMSEGRLRAIARTEVTRADNMGRLISMYGNDDVIGVEFCAVMDERTTDICQERDGMVLPLGDPRIPVNTPPLHVNCRSLWLPVTGHSHPQGAILEEKYERAMEAHPGIQRDQDIEEVRTLIESLSRMEAEGGARAKAMGPVPFFSKKQPPTPVPSTLVPHPDDLWVDEAKQMISALPPVPSESDLIALGEVAYDHLYSIVQTTPPDRLQETLVREMSRVRQFGGNINFVQGSDIFAKAYVREAAKMLPTDFVNEINQMGGVQAIIAYDPVTQEERAYCQYTGQHFIVAVDPRGTQIAIHELHHALEKLPGVLDIEGQFYKRRTVNGQLKELSVLTGDIHYQANEKAIEDDFAHPYMGKDYGGKFYEIFSQGAELMWYNEPYIDKRKVPAQRKTIWDDDKESTCLIIGLQLGWKP
jgi:SPP1 gp7 family putative phage head morphogenesis protein